MGVCLSRCAETHHQAGPAAIAHRNYSFDNNTESLKKFLHLQGTVKSSVLSSPRTSLGESSLAIPDSSELFSLPASEPDRSSFAISPSPGRTSRAPVSSHITSFSPKGRSSCSWGGRFSVDRTSTGCRKRIRPTPRMEHDVAAHQRLIEAIARLERLHEGKQSGLRASDRDRKDTTKAAQLTASRSRHVRHYQLPLQLPESSFCPSDTALATPVTPLANSVSNFLREVESYVSLIEAPRVSLSPEAIAVTKNGRPVPTAISRLASYRCDETDSDGMFTFFEATSSDEGDHVRKKSSPIATSLHRLVLSATQGCHPFQNLSPVAGKAPAQVSKTSKSLPSTSPNPGNRTTEHSREVLTNIDIVDPCIEPMREENGDDMNVVAVLKKSPSVRKPSPSRMRALKGFRRRMSLSLDSGESSAVHVDFDYLLRNAPIAASRLSNVSNNNSTTATASLIDVKSTEELVLLPVTSIPSCPDIKQEQAVYDEKDEANCTVEISDTESGVELATSEQPSPQVVLLADSDHSPTTSAESCLREPESLEENPSTIELAANSKSSSMNVLLDEDRSPSTLASAQSSFREPFNLDNNVESPETNARCEESLSPESCNECSLESISPSLCRSCPTETGTQADFHPIPDSTHSEVEGFQMFLSKAFNSLLKLLLVDRERTGPELNTAALDETMRSLKEENPDDSEQCS